MTQAQCEGCGKETPGYDITHYGSIDGVYRNLCSLCFNAEVAKLSGLDNFDNARLQPIGITDCAGELHQFHFVTRLLGHMVTLEAFELKEGQRAGYEFQIIGDPEEDQFALLGRMVSRIRKTLSVKHITDKGDGHGLQIADMTVRGRIECDLSEDIHMPCVVVVDGQEISWDEFGRMISSYEGWQFKLEILDRSDEL
jgi:hypothetical protein